ncbi:thioester reductase domain-containing protein [candidate division KSB1 bacterium]|nr:thioester reductase domain-containing protein [candidate division KSB1 bacterium]
MQSEPIAIVGIGCRFPGANSPLEFWNNLIAGRDLITSIPAERKLLKRFAINPPSERDRIPDFGGYIDGINLFDATHFKFSPREASSTDPQHRLMLHVTWEALEDAAINVDSLRGAHVPIYFGILGSDNHSLVYSDPEQFDLYTLVNNSFAALAGRVAHFFDWSGPAVGLDTACSSSPVSFHLACRSIWEGKAETAVAGGTNLILTPQFTMAFTRAGMLAPDGRCKAFDARGNGFVRSEGVAAIILKSLSAARRDGNPIYAVVRATHLNHDGGTGQYKTPNRSRQAAMLREIYAQNDMSPLDTQYIEAHGTGTKAGDPVEMSAISDIMGAGRDKQHPLLVGSVKTNIGHCEAASGMASIMKTALALKHRKIPGNLHFQEPNPLIDWDAIPVKIPTSTMDWPDTHGKPARAGVSAFGLTGVNAHIILESIDAPATESSTEAGPMIWVISSSSQDLISKAANRLDQFIENNQTSVMDVGRTLLTGRNLLPARAAVWGNNIDELRTELSALGRGEPTPGSVTNTVEGTRAPAVCFIFPGQGGQWPGMANQLYDTTPAFREAMEQVAAAIQQEAGYNPINEMRRPENDNQLHRLSIVQPTIFAVQVALAQLWGSLGLRPQAVIGHSMGEVAAAYISGILTLEHAVQVICRRSRLMEGLGKGGGMLVVGLPNDQAREIANKHAEHIALGVCNSPSSSVLSGRADVLQKIAVELESKNIFCRPVKVDIASHSPQVTPLKDAMFDELHEVAGQKIGIPFFSTVRPRFGRRPDDIAGFGAEYWWENLRNTVLFSDAVEAAIEQGISVFVEVNPHPILCQAVQQSAKATATLCALPTMRRNEDERLVLWRTIADLLTRGVKLNLKELTGTGQLLRLPTTPLREDQYPIDFDHYQQKKRAPVNNDLHPFVESEFQPAEKTSDRRWTVALNPSEQPLWEGHVVQGEMVFPGAGYIDLTFALGRRIFGAIPVEALNFKFEKALFLPADERVELQIVCHQSKKDIYEITFYNTANGVRHASGQLKKCDDPHAPANADTRSFQSPNWSVAFDNGDTFYAWLASLGLYYQDAFKKLNAVYYGDDKGLAAVSPSDNSIRGFAANPAILDNCFQAGFSTMLSMRNGDPSLYLPTSIRQIKLYDTNGLANACWVQAKRKEQSTSGFDVSLTVYGNDGRVLAQVDGLTATQLASKQMVESTEGTLWVQNWDACPLKTAPHPDLLQNRRWLVRSDGDIGEKVADLLEQQECEVWRVYRSLRFNDNFHKIDNRRFRIRISNNDDLHQLFEHIEAEGGVDALLDFWSLPETPVDECHSDTMAVAVERNTFPVVLLVQELAKRGMSPRLWLFTRNAWDIDNSSIAPGAARHALWGLGRVIRLEHPEFRCSLIDIAKGDLHEKAIFAELIANDKEQEIRLIGDERLIGRLALAPDDVKAETKVTDENDGKRPYRIEWTPENQLCVIPASQPKQQAHESIVSVRNSVLRIPDAENSNRLPVNAMGATLFGGTVESDSSNQVRAGDQVVWFGAKRSLTSTAVLRSDELWVLPPNLYLPDAIASAGPYLAAFYSLIDVAKLQHGDRVLIVAPNPLAIAAAHVVRWMRAETIVVIPGGDNGDFRNAGFLDVLDLDAKIIKTQIRNHFAQRQADILLLALPEPEQFIPAEYVSDDGHCIWMPFSANARPPRIHGNQTLSSLDIGRSFTYQPQRIRESWQRVSALLNSGTLPCVTLPQSRLSEVIAHPDDFQSGAEVVVTFDDVPLSETSRTLIRSDVSYLIVGGMGGLGLTICKELVEAGARTVVLVGRRAPSQTAMSAIEKMTAAGAIIVTLQGDMSYEADVRRVLDYIVDQLPPLAGVVNSAGLLVDATLLKQDRQRFIQAFPPKVQCAWNLHRLTRDLHLDFFVMFSSAAGLLGSPGQANYASANTFLDGLIQARRAQGLPGQAIQWGAWAEVGLAARPDRNDRLAWRGLESFPPEAGAKLFSSILERPEAIIAAMIFRPDRWRGANPGADSDMRFANLDKPVPSNALPLATAPMPSTAPDIAAPTGQFDGNAILNKLRSEVARIARVPESRLDNNASITQLGFDSLMMVELRASIEQAFNANVPIAVLIKGPNLQELSDRISSQTCAPVSAASPAQATTPNQTPVPEPPRSQDDILHRLRQEVSRIARVPESRMDNSSSITQLGFDSLMMVELRASIEQSFDVQIPIAALIKGPNLKDLSEMIKEKKQPAAAANVSSLIEADMKLAADIKVSRPRSLPIQMKHVLLTGATGFLGRHLVEAILRSDIQKISCVVRCGSSEKGLARLKQIVNDRDGLLESKVDVIPGDLSKPNWGMDTPLNKLLTSVDAVIHNGAAVNFIQPYETLRDTNVQSLLELLRNSVENPPMIHMISTWAVFSSPAYSSKAISETDWSAVLPESGYRQSKYIAEQLIKQAIERGFPIQLHRPALIGPHSQTGERNQTEFFGAMVAAALETGTAPDIELMVPIAAVDTITRGIVLSVMQGTPQSHTLHWCHHKPMAWREFIAWLAKAHDVRMLPYNEWRDHMKQQPDSAFAPFTPLLPTDLSTGDFGYLRAALKENQPNPFIVQQTVTMFPELRLDDDFSFASLEAFIRKFQE